MNPKFFERYLLILLLLLSFYNLFFTNNKLREATGMIDHVRTQLNLVSDSLSASKASLKELNEEFEKSKKHIYLISSEVEQISLKNRIQQEQKSAKRDSLKLELKKQADQLEQLKKELLTSENAQ